MREDLYCITESAETQRHLSSLTHTDTHMLTPYSQSEFEAWAVDGLGENQRSYSCMYVYKHRVELNTLKSSAD